MWVFTDFICRSNASFFDISSVALINSSQAFKETLESIKLAKEINAFAINPNNEFLTKEIVKNVQSFNIKVYPYTINDLYVNRNLTTEYHLELDMPNNNTWYGIGYFNAWTNSNVYIYSDASDVYWSIDPITLSFENNQTLDLDFDVSNSLSSVVGGYDKRAENGMLPTRVFEKTD